MPDPFATMPLSSDAVDLLEAMVAEGPQHEADWPGLAIKPLEWLGLIEPVGGDFWRISAEGVSALTLQIVRAG